MPVSRCAARRRDQQPCGALAASASASFCRHHQQLSERYGEDTVRAGSYPRHRNPRIDEPLELEAEPITTTEAVTVGPEAVRPALAQAAASSLDQIQAALLDAALGATREHWTTFTCTDCGKKQRAQVSIPDVRARLDAIELLLREGLGRVAQAEEPAPLRVPQTVEEIKNMSWRDMKLLYATIFAEQIATVRNGHGEARLRERLADLDDGTRNILREALEPA